MLSVCDAAYLFTTFIFSRFYTSFCLLSLFVFLKQKSIRVKVITLFLILNVTLPPRIANRVGEDSYCRGGIVHSRDVCSRALFVRRPRPKGLWRFRASTSNSRSGRTWPQTYTPIRHIYHTYAQQDIRVYEDDHFEPRQRQYSNPKAL